MPSKRPAGQQEYTLPDISFLTPLPRFSTFYCIRWDFSQLFSNKKNQSHAEKGHENCYNFVARYYATRATASQRFFDLTERGTLVKKSRITPLVLSAIVLAATSAWSCTDVLVGRLASADGSVITSHTADGAFYNARVTFIPGGKHEKGSTTPVFWNITNEEYGDPVKIGEIPQVEETYGYYNVGYPFMNEWGLAFGESTVSQKMEMKSFRPDAKAILTIEQLEVLALQRCKTAREAIKTMGTLAEKYGFLGSCDYEGESLCIADTKEAWVFELRSVGFTWQPDSGKPGAIWVARRVPDDMVTVTCNVSRIQEVHPEDTENYMASENYQQFAIDMGWWDPKSGEPFNWTKAYSPLLGGWAISSDWVRNRLYYTYSKLDPDREWDPWAEVTSYPFAIKPKKKVSVQDVQELLRSHMDGTIFDMYNADRWFIRDGDQLAKSPLASPFPTSAQRRLLQIPYSRPIAKWDCAYSFVAQVRDGMPKEATTVLWFGYDNPHTTCYVPIYNGVVDTPKSWRTFDRNLYSPDSAQWKFMLVDDLALEKYASSMKTLTKVRTPLEKKMVEDVAQMDEKLKAEKDPAARTKMATEFTNKCMTEVEEAWKNLGYQLISDNTNNK